MKNAIFKDEKMTSVLVIGMDGHDAFQAFPGEIRENDDGDLIVNEIAIKNDLTAVIAIGITNDNQYRLRTAHLAVAGIDGLLGVIEGWINKQYARAAIR